MIFKGSAQRGRPFDPRARRALVVSLGLAALVTGCDSSDPQPAQVNAGAALDAGSAVDAGPAPDAGITTAGCFPNLRPTAQGPLGAIHENLGATLGEHCRGTAHQQIEGVERVVFLGDSVTAGTPPTPRGETYRARLTAHLRERFGAELPVDSCAVIGANAVDLLHGEEQIAECFPEGGDTRRTLTIFTIGGNDIALWAKNQLPQAEATAEAEKVAQEIDEVVAWLKDETRFPKGSYVVYANPYEYTDGTGDLESCEVAAAAGLRNGWTAAFPTLRHLAERFTEIAVRHQADLVFSQETFCGHGYRRDDPEGPCYLGPEAELWFDLTCIHPNPMGHEVFAGLFSAVIGE